MARTAKNAAGVTGVVTITKEERSPNQALGRRPGLRSAPVRVKGASRWVEREPKKEDGMTAGRIIASTFILGFGSIFGVFHIFWGIRRLRRDGFKKTNVMTLLNFDKMQYETAPGHQLILLGTVSLVGAAIWYFYVFRTF